MAKTSKQQSSKADKRAQAIKAAAVPVSSDVEPNRPASGPLSGREVLAIAILLAVGFLVRLMFMPGEGHSTDVGTFEAWTLSLIKYGIHDFYDKAGFVDYPPGYLYVLAAFGWIYNLFSHANLPFDALKFAIKAPAVLADLGLAYLSF